MKRVFAVLLSLVVLAALPARAQQTESMRINASRVNMRRAPSIDSTIVRALAKGTIVTVLARDGNWIKVQLPGQATNGWVRSDMLTSIPATASTVPPGINPAKGSSGATTPSSSTAEPASTPPPAANKGSYKPVPPPPAPKPPKTMASGPSDGSYHGGFTIYGGMTMFNYKVTPTGSFTGENASGFAAGLGLIAHLGGPIGLELDAQYVQKGSADGSGSTKESQHDNYAGGALLLRPAFGSGKVRVFLLGGAEVGYLINCKASSGSTCTVDATERKRTDYGALVGGGISFGPLAVQLRYDIGMANLDKTAGVTAKNKGLLILGSLIF
jgi:uncharacterized protein YraI